MKKFVSLVLSLTMLLGLASFAMAEDVKELALITDIGTINDKSFNQGSWEGLVQYAEEHDITHDYYQPAEASDGAYLDAIQLAAGKGAKVIVTPGYFFAPSVGEAQSLYPEINFVLLDAFPDGGTMENAVGVLFAEEESGFLAGYAAVKEGFTNLGFMGGVAVPAVIRYGYGFVQGAEYAAKEMGIEGVTINYNYTGSFEATPDINTLAAAWYNDGVEIIFSCGGGIFNSITAAAEAAEGKWVIGVDVDQNSESDVVLTSAMKDLTTTVYNMADAFYNDTFPGGEELTLGADQQGVGLPMDTSRFSTFTQADYDAIFEKLVAGEIEIIKDDGAAAADAIPTEIVKVTVI